MLPNNRTNLCNKVHISTITDADSGEVICITCGAVVSDKAIEIGPEWRSFTNSGVSLSRVGMPTSLAKHDQGLSTRIGRENRDFTGEMIFDPSILSILQRIRTWDYRTQTRSSKGISRKIAFGQLDRLKQKLALPDPVVQKAAYIYRKVQQKEIVRGRTRNGAMASMCIHCM